MARQLTSTQQKLLCDLRQDQLSACAAHILRTTQLLVLGRGADQKIVQAETLALAQIQARLQGMIRDAMAPPSAGSNSNKLLEGFCEFMDDDELCRHLPTVIPQLCKSYIELLQLPQTTVCSNPMQRLCIFALRTCSERPALLSAGENDRTGAGLEAFRERLQKLYAECLLLGEMPRK